MYWSLFRTITYDGLHDYDEINSRLSEQSCTGHFSEQSRITHVQHIELSHVPIQALQSSHLPLGLRKEGGGGGGEAISLYFLGHRSSEWHWPTQK